jgi:hypothetical protein
MELQKEIEALGVQIFAEMQVKSQACSTETTGKVA